MRSTLRALLLLALPSSLAAQAAPADLIVTNARIYTVDDSRPVVAAMAVRDGRIAFTGSLREAMALKGATTRVLDVGGRTVIPGMVDAHAHLYGLGKPAKGRTATGSSASIRAFGRSTSRAQ